jgi:hypothetical protein
VTEKITLANQIETTMIHKMQYFETKNLSHGAYLQDVVNDFLAGKGENIITVLPVIENTLLVHYKE